MSLPRRSGWQEGERKASLASRSDQQSGPPPKGIFLGSKRSERTDGQTGRRTDRRRVKHPCKVNSVTVSAKQKHLRCLHGSTKWVLTHSTHSQKQRTCLFGAPPLSTLWCQTRRARGFCFRMPPPKGGGVFADLALGYGCSSAHLSAFGVGVGQEQTSASSGRTNESVALLSPPLSQGCRGK